MRRRSVSHTEDQLGFNLVSAPPFFTQSAPPEGSRALSVQADAIQLMAFKRTALKLTALKLTAD
ncbi:MAG: hypothetical protein AAFN74_03820 [Myxococcota bacterium]